MGTPTTTAVEVRDGELQQTINQALELIDRLNSLDVGLRDTVGRVFNRDFTSRDDEAVPARGGELGDLRDRLDGAISWVKQAQEAADVLAQL